MKKLMLTLIAAITVMAASAKVVKTKIKVNGYKPKAKIENVAKEIKGVKAATYNEKNKSLNVSYENDIVKPSKIRAAVLKVDKKEDKAPVAKKKACKIQRR